MKRVPTLRFKEFSGNLQKKNLDSLCIEKISYGIVQTGQDIKDGIPCVRVVDLTSSSIDTSKMIKTTKKISDSYKKTILTGGDIMFALRGEIGLSKKVTPNLIGANLTRGIARLYPDKSFMDSDFLHHHITSPYTKSSIAKQVNGSALKEIPLSGVRKVSVTIPSKQEQGKIASFLTSVDTKIEQLTSKTELLQEYKKGVMQKIFSQEIRFKDDDGSDYPEWIEKKLGEIGKTFNGLTGKTKEDFGSGKRYIQYKQIFDNSRIDIANFGYVTIRGNEKQNSAQYGDVFFTTSSETPLEIGFTSVLLDRVEEVYLNSFCFGYRVHSLQVLSPSYAQYLFRNQTFRKEIIKLAQGSTRYNMSKVELMKIKIFLPSSKEQRKIANFLSSIDSKIEKTQKQLDSTKEFKKALLQQMFV